jgi:LysM domain
MSDDTKHVVKSSDCLSKIAKEYGFTWQKLWDYGPNAPLKAKRKDPNILMPGDIVYIPVPKEKKSSKQQDKAHKFIRKLEQADLHLRILLDGEPVKNVQLVLVIDNVIPKFEKKGKTNTDGYVEIEGTTDIKIPSDATEGTLRLGSPNCVLTYLLTIGHLRPVKKRIGFQQRLNNLGFEAGQEDGEENASFKRARDRFQRMYELSPTEIEAKIVDLHGC